MSRSADSRPRPLKHDVGGKVPRLRFSIGRKGKSPIQKRRTAQNVKERPAKMHPSQQGSRESDSRVLQWLVLCGIPYRGSGVRLGAPHPAQRTSFPLPSWGRPHGHREAPLLICNSQRVAHARPYCKFCSGSAPGCAAFAPCCNRPKRAANRQQGRREARGNPGFRRQFGRQWRGTIRPKSVSPLTKNCMARATSSRPMMRTRMRMPVSPMTWRTRPAPASTQ